jgi:hypothetical protein
VRPTLTCKVVWWQWGQVIISTVYLAPTTLATPRKFDPFLYQIKSLFFQNQSSPSNRSL